MNKELENTAKVAELLQQLDVWIGDCQKQADFFFERNMITSEISSVAMKIAYVNVKKLLLQK